MLIALVTFSVMVDLKGNSTSSNIPDLIRARGNQQYKKQKTPIV